MSMSDGRSEAIAAAKAAIASGNVPEGIRLYEAVIAADPENSEAYYGLGIAHYMTGNAEQAAACFERVKTLDPLHAGAFTNLGALANIRKEYDEAIRLLKRALEIDPKRFEAHFNLGIAYRDLGQTSQAVIHFQQALQLIPHQYDALVCLAECYFRLNRVAEAVHHFELALQVRPDSERARRGLQAAKQRLDAELSSASLHQREETPIIPGDSTSRMDPAEVLLNREVDPDSDGDLLTGIHQHAREINEQVVAWKQLTDRMVEVLHQLDVDLSAGRPAAHNRQLILVLREAMKRFWEAGTHSVDQLKGVRSNLGRLIQQTLASADDEYIDA